MPLRDILFVADDTELTAKSLPRVLEFCKAHDARLTALYAYPPGQNTAYSSMAYPGVVFAGDDVEGRARAAEQQAMVKQAADDAGVANDWFEVASMAMTHVLNRARLTDMMVLTQDQDGKGRFSSSVLGDDLLTRTGRPTLIIPHFDTQLTPLDVIMVAWDGGQASTRAVHDAMPLLCEAGKVVIASMFDAAQEQQVIDDCTALAEHLQRHGVNAQVNAQPRSKLDVATQLMNQTTDDGAQLLVMGAYGHSRLQEKMFGGVTRKLLQSMPVPLLVSH